MSLDKTQLCKELKVSQITQETADAVSLIFEIPTDLKKQFDYKPGQFVTLFLGFADGEIRRSYSLASSPDFDRDFKITVKRVPGGKGSTHLTQNVKVGDKLWVTPPAGHFTLPENVSAKKIVLYAAGSGITPVYSILKSTLKRHPFVECILIYQNKNTENTIYASELNVLQNQFSNQLKIEHIYSSAPAQWQGPKGRISPAFIRDLLTKHLVGIQALHFMCGPDAFMTTVRETLAEMNVPKDKIFFESFASLPPPTADKPATTNAAGVFKLDQDAIVIGDKSDVSPPEEIEVLLDGETKTVKHIKDATVLESLIQAGINPPYSCMDGACMACIAKIEKGAVYQNDMGILSDDNIEAKECLTCQARPASKKIRVNYSVF